LPHPVLLRRSALLRWLRLRTRNAARSKPLTLLTHRNIGVLAAHQETLRLGSVQPVVNSRVTTLLLLLSTALNIGLIGPLGAISRNLPQQVLGAFATEPLQHRQGLLVLPQPRSIRSHQSHLFAPLSEHLTR
jgi:hypothetical protein